MGIDMYLRIDGIQGECTDSKHPKWIDVSANILYVIRTLEPDRTVPLTT